MTRLYHVHAFAGRVDGGNPAAVCILPYEQPDPWMQDLAMAMGYSETAFVVPRSDGYALRWFTPTTEVDLCGHATLASAKVLWECGRAPEDQDIFFYTRSGQLVARKVGHLVEMDFPASPPKCIDDPDDSLARALGVDALYIGTNDVDLLVEVKSETTLRALRPRFEMLRELPYRGVCVTSTSYALAYDFTSRFFAPAAGINEDPVTGSAHCYLGPYWSAKLDKKELVGYQASERGGVVRIRLVNDRAWLAGEAIIVKTDEIEL